MANSDIFLTTFSEIESLLRTQAGVDRSTPFYRLIDLASVKNRSVGTAVTDMRSGSFSQLPIILNGNVVALLTSETVVRWMATAVESQTLNPWATEISAVIGHAENANHYCFLSRKATMLEALFKFEDFSARGRTLDAILISENGRADQKLLGILTIYDLPDILDTLGLKRVPRP